MNDGKSTEKIFYKFQKFSKRHDSRYSDSVVGNLIARNFIFDVKVRFEGKRKKILLHVEGEYFPKSSTNHGTTFLDTQTSCVSTGSSRYVASLSNTID